jgi:hypothetical protein
MQRVSIQVEDNIAVIDKKVMMVDCTQLRSNRISALQWYGDHGEIEYQEHKKPNEVIHSFDEFQSLVTAAKPIPSPKPPTPKELEEMHNRFMLEHPDARRAWEERDAEVKRLFAEAFRRAEAAQPQPPIQPPTPTHPTPPQPTHPVPPKPQNPAKPPTSTKQKTKEK